MYTIFLHKSQSQGESNSDFLGISYAALFRTSLSVAFISIFKSMLRHTRPTNQGTPKHKSFADLQNKLGPSAPAPQNSNVHLISCHRQSSGYKATLVEYISQCSDLLHLPRRHGSLVASWISQWRDEPPSAMACANHKHQQLRRFSHVQPVICDLVVA